MSTAPTPISYQQYVPSTVQLAVDCAGYTAITGQRAPLFRTNWPIQNWWDTAAANLPSSGTYSLAYINTTLVVFARENITNQQAATPNLAVKGTTFQTLAQWQAAQAAVQTATVVGFAPPTTEAPNTNENYRLISPAIAAQALAEINADTGVGATIVVNTQIASGENWQYDPNDDRRDYNLVIGVNSWSLIQVLYQRFAGGVWCPGAWSLPATLANEGPLFIEQQYPANAQSQGVVPYPVAPQFMTAAYNLVSVGMTTGDVVLEPVAPPPASALTLQDVINAINALETRIVAAFKQVFGASV